MQLINQDRKVPKDTPFTGSDRFDIISLYENLLTMVYLKREASEPVLQKVCLEALSDCYNLHPAIPSAVIRYATWMSRNGDKLEKLPNGKLGRKVDRSYKNIYRVLKGLKAVWPKASTLPVDCHVDCCEKMIWSHHCKDFLFLSLSARC